MLNTLKRISKLATFSPASTFNQENAEMLRGILGGEKGARRDIVVLNAAAALVAGNQAPDLKQGAQVAQEAIDSGRALEKLDRLVKLSQSLG